MCVPTAGLEGTIQSWEDVAGPQVCYSDTNLAADGGRVWQEPTADKRDMRATSLSVRDGCPDKYTCSLKERKTGEGNLVVFFSIYCVDRVQLTYQGHFLEFSFFLACK